MVNAIVPAAKAVRVNFVDNTVRESAKRTATKVATKSEIVSHLIKEKKIKVVAGFGSRVADALMMAGLAPRFGKFGVTNALRGQIGSQTWLLDTLGSVEDHAQALM
jgi:transketolase C-terminal domain/subunit